MQWACKVTSNPLLHKLLVESCPVIAENCPFIPFVYFTDIFVSKTFPFSNCSGRTMPGTPGSPKIFVVFAQIKAFLGHVNQNVSLNILNSK